MKQRLWFTVVLVSVLLGWFLTRGKGPSGQAPPRTDEAPMAMRTAAAPAVPVSYPTAPPQSPQVATGPSPADAGVDPAMQPNYARAVRVRNMQRLTEAWRKTSPDLEWTKRTEVRLVQQLSAHGIKGQLDEVDCRTNLCRVKFDFAGLNDARALYKIERLPEYNMYPDAVMENNRAKVTVFVSKPGVNVNAITNPPVR